MKHILFTLLLLFSIPCYGIEGGWIEKDGTPVKNTDAMKSINGFGGWLLITSDQYWEEKWNTPEHTTPNFNEANKVFKGEKITILPLFINAKVDKNKNIFLTCDIKITNPYGEIIHEEKDIECFNEKSEGNPRNIRMAYSVIDFIAKESDPFGKWTVEFTFVDKNSKTKIPLKNHFDLKKSKKGKQNNAMDKRSARFSENHLATKFIEESKFSGVNLCCPLS